jgi:hypothetical protein
MALFSQWVTSFLLSVTKMSDVSALAVGDLARQMTMVVLILVIVRYWECRSIRSIGLRGISMTDIFAATVTWLLLDCLVVALMNLPLSPLFNPSLKVHPTQQGFHRTLEQAPEWSRISFVIGNSFAEEIGRAYAIERLSEVTSSLYVGAFLALLCSLGTHVYYGGIDSAFFVLAGYTCVRSTLSLAAEYSRLRGWPHSAQWLLPRYVVPSADGYDPSSSSARLLNCVGEFSPYGNIA